MITVAFDEREPPLRRNKEEVAVWATFTCEHCGWQDSVRAFHIDTEERRIQCRIVVDLDQAWNHRCEPAPTRPARKEE